MLLSSSYTYKHLVFPAPLIHYMSVLKSSLNRFSYIPTLFSYLLLYFAQTAIFGYATRTNISYRQ